MASTQAGRRLTETHRLAQARIGAAAVAQLDAVWPVLDPADLEGTFERWVRAAEPVIARQHAVSTELSSRYVTALRSIELPGAPPAAVVLASPPASEAVATSLLVTGPAKIRSDLARGVTFDNAVSAARAATARAGYRHVRSGGRDTIAASVAADRRGLGWARVTSARPCSFCALLASRGPVYSGDTVRFEAHDACSCTAEPVYRKAGQDAWPPGAARFRAIYDEVAKGLPASEAHAAFRRALATTR